MGRSDGGGVVGDPAGAGLPAMSAAATPAPAASRPGNGRDRGSRSLLFMFSAVVIVMLVGMATALMVYLRATELRDADRQMVNLGAVLAEQTARTMQSAELVLDLIEGQLAHPEGGGADPAALHAMLNNRIAGIPQIKQATIVGPDGKVIAMSRLYPTPDLWLGDRPNFMRHRDDPTARLLIGEPIRGRLSGEWMIIVSRRLARPDGSFAGALDVGLDPAYFESVYRSATMTEGTAITLLRDDATVLARYPRDGSEIGQRLVDSVIFRRIDAAAGGGAIHSFSRFSHETRIFAPRPVPGYPLVVNPSISEAVVLTTWRRQVWFVGAAAIGATIAIILLMVLLRASEARGRRQAVMLQDAVDALPEGFILYDADDRLVLCNERFRELRARDPVSYEPGTSFEEMVRLAIKTGEIVIPKDEDLETWMRQRLAQHRSASGMILRESGGRILRISERKTSDGGIVSIHTDVTELKRAQSDVEAARARMADWAAASNDWFWETDAEHRFTLISEGIEKATGLRPARLLGQRLDAAPILEGIAEKVPDYLATVAARLPFRDVVVAGARPDGRPYFVSVSGKPIADPEAGFAGYRGTGRDVTVEIQAERELARQAEIFATLIENLPVGVTLVDHELRFVAFNRPFLDIYDLQPAMLEIGDSFEKFIRYHAARGEYGPGAIDELARPRVERALDRQPHQFERRRPNGQVVEIRRVPLPGGGFVTTYIDVTTARQRERDLEETRARLEHQAVELIEARIEADTARAAADAANRAKSLFLANMSHELRTPLNAILGFSEITREAMMGPLDARYRDYAREIHASGHYLLRLINDVLDTSKIEVERMSLHEELVDVVDLVAECQRLLRERAEERNLAFEVALPAELPGLRADRLRIKQILLNLLSNAIKFTPESGRVSVSAVVPVDGGLALMVADNGIGMRAEDIPVALEPFRQIENPLTRHYEGTGLGLPLAKALAELHGGTLTIASELGRGTTVTVWLPPRRLRWPPRAAEPDRAAAR
jgi:PAS domain S-box-containing protein